MIDVTHHLGHSFAKTHCWLPPQLSMNLGCVSPCAIRFARSHGNVHHFSTDELNELVDGFRGIRAAVPYLTGDWSLSRQAKGFSNISHMHKVAPLRPIADHRQWASCKFLPQKDPEHSPVCPSGSHARSVCVKDSNGINWKLVHLGPVKKSLFAKVF